MPYGIPFPNAREQRRINLSLSLLNEQAKGNSAIASKSGKIRAERSDSVDRTWAVRDMEQTKRQRKRDRDRKKFRPILTFTETAKILWCSEWR